MQSTSLTEVFSISRCGLRIPLICGVAEQFSLGVSGSLMVLSVAIANRTIVALLRSQPSVLRGYSNVRLEY